MEAGPHPLVERFVGALLPPACREHVLGDLHERFVSSRQYVHEVIWTIPFAVWGQVRRTSSAPLAIAEVGVVYVVFLSALRTLDPSAWHDSLSLVRPAIPALAALVAVVIRDAWVGRRPRPSIHIAADAWLGVACAAVPQGLLVAAGSTLALHPTAFLAGCATSLVLLSAVRGALSPVNQRASTANAGGMPMKPPTVQVPARRRPLVIGVIALAFILGAAKFLLSPNAGPLPRLMAFVVPMSMAVLLIATHYFTLRFTDRAAAAFQREIDALDSNDPGSRPR